MPTVNTKELYSVVNNLLSRDVDKVYPSSECNKDLSNKFSNFFVNKIKDIRCSFDDKSHSESNDINYLPESTKLELMNPTTEDELRTVIKNRVESSRPLMIPYRPLSLKTI